MKAYLIFLLMIMPMALSIGQAGGVVYDPTADYNAKKNIVESLKQFKLLKAMKESQDVIQKAMATNENIKKLKSYKQVLDLLAGIACNIRRLNINLSYDNTLSYYCFFQNKYDMSLVRYQAANDLLGTAISAVVSISQGDRINQVQSAIDELKSANDELEDLNQMIEYKMEKNFKRGLEKIEIIDMHIMRYSDSRNGLNQWG